MKRTTPLVPKKYFLLGLFVLALAARLIFFNMFLRDNPIQLAFDSGHYHNVAVSMVQGHGFSDNKGKPYFYRVPGYPVFLAGCYKVFGIDPTKALLAQLVLACLIPILMFFFSLACFPSRPLLAKAAGGFSVFHLGLLIFSGLVMTETMFMIMFLLFLIFFMRSLSQSHSSAFIPWDMALAGLFLGLASLIRPVGLALIAFACVVIFFTSSSQAVKKIVSLLVTWSMIMCIWVLRNFLLTGSIFLSTLSGPHCINHGAVRVIMDGQQCSWQEAQRLVQGELMVKRNEAQAPYGRSLQEIELSNIAEAYALSVFKTYPYQTIKLCLMNMFKTVFSLYCSELLCIDSGGTLPPYQSNRSVKDLITRFLCPEVHDKRIIAVIYFEMIMHLFILLGLLGFCIFFTDNSTVMALAIGFAIIFVGLSSLCGFARLRLPIEPFFIMLSLMFWLKVLGRERG